MDILIPDSWLKKFLETNATPEEIAKYLSLSGPSVEKIENAPDGDKVYSIEVTTNRVDSASILGIAREASAILPRFGIKAKIKNHNLRIKNGFKFVKKVKYLSVSADPKLCPRFTALLIKNVTVKESPKEIKSLLEKVGVRPINNIVDVSNYIMHELGQPVHTFDYDKIVSASMILRESRQGEELTTLDGKKFILDGGDIVIEDGSGILIDLCGIMGGQNSMIDENTKNVLLFVQVYNEHKIRKTSMSLAQRSEAAVLFEKGLDTEQVGPSIIRAAQMIQTLSGGVPETEILDIYSKPYRVKSIPTTLKFLKRIIGVEFKPNEVISYLTPLGFEVKVAKDKVEVSVPSFRAKDMFIEEDIAEEVARIYGYHNLPNVLMEGPLPSPRINKSFILENRIKDLLTSFGAYEVLNLSLTDKMEAGYKALELRNPLGSDTMYLRTSLLPQLIKNLKDNPTADNLHIFEMSNVYQKKPGDLPDEKLMLSGILKNYDYRKSKGIIQKLLSELNIDYDEKLTDGKEYKPEQKIEIYSDKIKIGEYGNLHDGFFHYEFEVDKLVHAKSLDIKFKEPSKYPPQIEDITFVLPEKTRIGDVVSQISNLKSQISLVELKDVFENAFTFRINYQSPIKTLTDKEVVEIRNKIIKKVKEKFGGQIKA